LAVHYRGLKATAKRGQPLRDCSNGFTKRYFTNSRGQTLAAATRPYRTGSRWIL